MAEHVVRKLTVDDDNLGLEVGCDSGESRSVLGRFNLEIRIGEEGGHRAQYHGADESRHRGNALRHDDDHAIAGRHALVAEYRGLQSGTLPELGKCHGLALVFVDPGGNKWAIAGSGGERVDEIAEAGHAAGHCSGCKR